MANQEQLETLLSGPENWNQYREENPDAIIDLTGANLSTANLPGVNLSGACLESVNLSRAYLSGADLERANLSEAYLYNANLTGINLADADLIRANLTDAIMVRANLVRANLTGAYLTEADLTNAILTDADLTNAYLTKALLTDAILTNVKTKNPIPKIKNLKQKILAEIEKNPEALNMRIWHTCKTTHCLAGWAVTLAGQAGKVLERELSSAGVGACIFFESCGEVPNFYSSKETAIQWLKK